MELYLPYYTDDIELNNKQLFLNQVFLPQLSNNKTNLHKFYKSDKAVEEEKRRDKDISNKFISFNAQHGCDFESFMRFSKTKDRKKHIEFMENIKPHQLAALSPFARFYFIPEGGKSSSDIKKNAIPIVFDKGFDLDQLMSTRNTTSRGEGAGLLSINVNRQYDVTGDFDPISFSARFFFSSYDVFINKPAIERGELFGFSYQSNLSGIGARTGFFNEIRGANITYKELIRRPTGQKGPDGTTAAPLFTILLEYGWTYSESLSDDILSQKEKEIIDNFEKTYYKLSPKEHKINFNPDGSFNLDVEYIPTFLENVDRATNFKENIYDFPGASTDDVYSEINSYKELIGKLRKENKKKGTKKETIKKNNEKIKKAKASLKSAQDKYSGLFAKQFTVLARRKNLMNSYKLTSKQEGDKYIYSLTVKNNKLGEETFTRSYSSTKIGQSLVKLLEENQRKEFFSGDSEISEAVMSDILSRMAPENLSAEFMFVKDIFRLLYYIAGDNRQLDNGTKVPYPYHIFGNIAFPTQTGKKFWCNVGDLPISTFILRAKIQKFVKIYPNGTPRQFIVYFLHKIVPEVFTNKKSRPSFPAIATPFFHFDAAKFRTSESATGFKGLLFRGAFPEKVLNEFSKSYFNDAKIGSAEGCFFIGQTNSLFYENSKLFISDKIKAFQDNFFKDDNKLTEIGIGKVIVGSSKGLVKNLSFSSNSDDTITNLSYALSGLKIGVPDDLITTNFQYTVSAELFGNRIFDFSNLIYIPSWTFGKAVEAPRLADGQAPTVNQLEQLRRASQSNDFEIGGLYTVNSISDALMLANGSYTKTLNASCILRDSTINSQKLKEFEQDNKGVLTPIKNENVPLIEYLDVNFDLIAVRLRKDVKEITEWGKKTKFGVPKTADGEPLVKPLSLEKGTPLAGSLMEQDEIFNELSEENQIRQQKLEFLTDQRFESPLVTNALNTEVPENEN